MLTPYKKVAANVEEKVEFTQNFRENNFPVKIHSLPSWKNLTKFLQKTDNVLAENYP